MQFWYRIQPTYRAYIAAFLGFLYAWYWVLIAALIQGIEVKINAKPEALPLLYIFFVTNLGPFGIGFAAIFFLTYLRKRLWVISWLSTSIIGGLFFAKFHLPSIPPIADQVNFYREFLIFPFASFQQALFFIAPHLFAIVPLVYWFITPLRREVSIG